jgi:serine/threonine protein kinase
VRDLLAEGALLAQLGASKPHRNIIRLIGSGRADDGLPFLVIERLSATLAEVLPKPRIYCCTDLPEPEEVSVCEWALVASRWPLARSLHVAHQLALALRHLHEREPIARTAVLHRDLKPDNVGFLADGGGLVLFDFGLATRWEHASEPANPEAAPLREAGAAAPDAPRQLSGQTGSTRYMAPEVALSLPYNGRAEVFSFATVRLTRLDSTRTRLDLT